MRKKLFISELLTTVFYLLCTTFKILLSCNVKESFIRDEIKKKKLYLYLVPLGI